MTTTKILYYSLAFVLDVFLILAFEYIVLQLKIILQKIIIKVDIKYMYAENDSYSMNSNVQFGCFYFSIPTSSTSILLRLQIEGQFSIAEGGTWGSCWGTASGTHNNYITIS